jgi:hypothetical protein
MSSKLNRVGFYSLPNMIFLNKKKCLEIVSNCTSNLIFGAIKNLQDQNYKSHYENKE